MNDLTNTITLSWHDYKYLPYEKELAYREVKNLLGSTIMQEIKDGIEIQGVVEASILARLVYFAGYQQNEIWQHTLQYYLEQSCVVHGARRRQSTRYSVHGLHEYKGKFNPQIVRAVLNVLKLPTHATILDPFCGSGTSLVECSHIGLRSIGYDVNPLAVMIATAKLKALTIPAQTLHDFCTVFWQTFQNKKRKKFSLQETEENDRLRYLKSWFSEEILCEIEDMRFVAQTLNSDYSAIILILLSNLLREYSFQEPRDLRIRRRFSPPPTLPLLDVFKEATNKFVRNLAAVQDVLGVREHTSYALLADSRRMNAVNNQEVFDAVITSPPYATALPYIDTQRLSLVWLGLAQPKELPGLEAYLTGSRDVQSNQKSIWMESFENNHGNLPASVYLFCRNLQSSLNDTDGFRKQLVPILLYRYCCDMQDVFSSVLQKVRVEAPFALIIGHNRTVLGGKKFDIDTPQLLKEIAVSVGWNYQESIPLQTYQRYGLHAANAVQGETLLILRKRREAE